MNSTVSDDEIEEKYSFLEEFEATKAQSVPSVDNSVDDDASFVLDTDDEAATNDVTSVTSRPDDADKSQDINDSKGFQQYTEFVMLPLLPNYFA